MHLSTSHLALVALPLLIAPLIAAQTTCNGHAELCDRSYGNVTFVGAHDSYAVGSSGVAVNQDYNITQQLNDGVRLLQSQVHNSSGTIELCHTSCILFDGGPLSTYLSEIKTWMDANPNDVVTLLIVNSDDFEPTAFDTVFKAAGLDTLSYAPPSAAITNSQWPTLGSLIGNGTRLVTFLDAMADFTSVNYLIEEFTNVWETAFDVTDTTFNCDVNRTQGDSSTQMYLINHFLDSLLLGQPTPNKAQANITNGVSGVGSLGVQVETCAAEYSRNPNYLLVDFYEFGGGSVFEVAATANGVTYSPATPIATPITSGSASSTTVTSTKNGAVPLLQLDWLKATVLVGGVLLGACSVV
ncbi:PLC-like phosphodiesterase [Athelia psychrophila]|uniref:PLC-like phosphodiesterase n=1 Tax=Athelia psychrophila TaxID=1759441 RepID=A0A166NVE6_9AGAM|nr:PLC-like phosphodiesterase [Fibularhizoctonia sp. CBS 109695]